jgi:aminocarboxymuconate-semialdehyde decarboxylase
MRIDAHAHVIVPELLREPWGPRVRWEDGAQIVELGGRPIRSAVRDFVAIDGILAAQDEAGIDRIVLCPWVNLLGYEVPVDEARERARIQNGGLAALRDAHPDRVSVLGTVPLQAPEVAAAELEALMATGFAGVEIAASVNGTPLGDDSLGPFWAAAEANGALVFVHPTTRGYADGAFADYYLWNLVGNPMETTLAAAHLVLSGVLERHPDLRVLLAHGGGAITALRGRLRHGWSFQPQTRSKLTKSPEASLKRLYYDTVTHDPAVLRELVAFAGAERVLLGSDYPFDMADARPAETVAAAGLAPDAERLVLGGNAARLLGLEVHR